MEYETILSLIISFFGGGLVAALLNWARTSRSEAQSLKAERIKKQLNNLYGPLYFLASQADELHKLSNQHSHAYDAEYIENQNAKPEDAETAIEINNHYARMLQHLGEKAVETMQEAYSYIDPKDSDAFQLLVIDSIRLNTEREETGRLKTPLEIYKHIGTIKFFREDFISLIKYRFQEKTDALEALEK